MASMFTFDRVPAVPLPILIINGAKDQEVRIEGSMSRSPLVSRVQEAPYKSLKDVVAFWVDINKSSAYSGVVTKGTVATSTYVATLNGVTTSFVEDSEGGHGGPGSRARREGNAPIELFSGAERVWEFFKTSSGYRTVLGPQIPTSIPESGARTP